MITEQSSSKVATAGDLQIHYNEAGEGECVIMLHGGGPGASGWSNFKQNLPVFGEHFRTLLVDQPGYGKSSKPKHQLTQVEIGARAIRDLLDTLGIEKAHLVGNSMGGATSLKFALEYPDRLDKLVLMGPGGGSVNIFSPAPTEGMKVLMDFYAPPGPSIEKTQALIDSMLYDPSLVGQELLQERLDAALDQESMDYVMNMFANIAGAGNPMEDLWMRIHEIQHETLLIWGFDDRVLPVEGSMFMLKQMPDARLVIFKECGHWAQLEKQKEFERASIPFLQDA